MCRRPARALASALLALSCAPAVACASAPRQPPISEKEARTPAQRKINSQVLYEIYRRRGIAAQMQVPPGPTGVRIDPKGRAYIDVRAELTPALQKKVTSLGAEIVQTSKEGRSIVAWIPLLKIEDLARDARVRAIEPVADAAIRK